MEEVLRSNKEPNIELDKDKGSKFFLPANLDKITPKVSLVSKSI